MTTIRREIIERSREAKKRQRKINFFLLLVIIILTLILFIQIFNHPKLSYGHVVLIDSSGKLDNLDILTLVGYELNGKYGWVLSKRNFFFYPNETLKKLLLSKFPRIKDLEFKSEGNTLKIITTVREPKYMWCHNAEDFCQYLDSEGIALGLAPKFSGETLLVFSPFSTNTEVTKLGSSPSFGGDFSKLINLIGELSEALNDSPFSTYRIKIVQILNAGDYNAKLFSDQREAYPLSLTFSIKNAPQNTLGYLKSVFSSPEFKASLSVNSKPLKSLDLRFDQKVFYEFWE